MLNEMPELKSGMVVEYSKPLERFFIMKTSGNELFGISNGELWFSEVQNEKINKIWNINTPIKFLSDTNLNYCAELVWERKPEVDWSKIAVDTKILVKQRERWEKAYFEKNIEDVVYAFWEGRTSFTAKGSTWFRISTGYVVLYEGNESLVGE